MSNIPLITKADIAAYINVVASQLTPIVEVSTIYPRTDDIIPYGIYVDDVSTINREVNQLGISTCGSIYNMTDQFSILFVSIQDDPNWPVLEERIQSMSADAQFFNGYYQVTFNQTIVVGNRSEKRTYSFELKRLNFND